MLREEILSWLWALRGIPHVDLCWRGTEQYNKLFRSVVSLLIFYIFDNVLKAKDYDFLIIVTFLLYFYTFLFLCIYCYLWNINSKNFFALFIMASIYNVLIYCSKSLPFSVFCYKIDIIRYHKWTLKLS